MKKLLFVLLVQLLTFSVYGQVDVFVEVAGSYPFIPTLEKRIEATGPPPETGYMVVYPAYTVKESFESSPGFELLVGARKSFLKQFSIETGLGFSVLNYKRKVALTSHTEEWSEGTVFGPEPGGDIIFEEYGSFTGNGEISGFPENVGKTRICYLNIPLNFSFSVFKDKLSIGGGIFSSLLVASGQTTAEFNIEGGSTGDGTGIPDRWGVGEDSPEPGPVIYRIREKRDTTGNGLNKLLWSGNVMLEYKVVKNISVNTAYQHGFSSIYTNQYSSGEPKSRLLKVGLRYFL